VLRRHLRQQRRSTSGGRGGAGEAYRRITWLISCPSNIESGVVADAVLVIPPPSPSDTNPPLGPAIIAQAAHRAGFSIRVIDLNAFHISRFRGKLPHRSTPALGDHGKDRLLVAHAARSLYAATGLYDCTPKYLPDGADPVAGMHYSLEALTTAVLAQSADGTWWDEWLTTDLFDRIDSPPPVFGVSIMGASQVFPALVIFALAKRRWPSSVTVAGGSHITLMADSIRRNNRYRKDIDVIMPGHSEDAFVRLLRRINPIAATTESESQTTSDEFEYVPLFSGDQLSLYGAGTVAMPLQFTRGCAYGRCTFCTYPAVEPILTRFDPARAQAAVSALVADHGIRTFSVKDSLFTVPMMEGFARALDASGSGPIKWSATTKVNRRLAALAPLLAESGLITIELGIESINPIAQKLFDKQADLAMIEDVILALTGQGVLVVINLIFGAPGETADDAERQLAWYTRMRKMAAGYIDGSLNLLEIVRGSPMEMMPPAGVALSGVAPWAYCYQWNTPCWRSTFAERLRDVELAALHASATASPEPSEDPVSGDQRRIS
jgi:hypothetical protein